MYALQKVLIYVSEHGLKCFARKNLLDGTVFSDSVSALCQALSMCLYKYRDISKEYKLFDVSYRTGYAATQPISFSSILKLKARNVYHGC